MLIQSYIQIVLFTIGVAILFFSFKLFFTKKNTYISRHAYNMYNGIMDSDSSPILVSTLQHEKQSFLKSIIRKITRKKGLSVSRYAIIPRSTLFYK